QRAVLMPDHVWVFAGQLLQRGLRIAVAIGSGKNDDGRFHAFSSISYFSITVLARSFSHMSFSEARALASSLSFSSRSITLPCRTSPTAPKPRPCSALPMALPCGSRTPFLRVTNTRAFKFVSIATLPLREGRKIRAKRRYFSGRGHA